MSEDDFCQAIWEGNMERVRKLVMAGANLDTDGIYGLTPMMQAAELESTTIARYLIECGADVNGANSEGDTPLHIAVDISIDGTIQNNGAPGDEPLEMIRVLLECGADTGLTNIKGESALDIAKNYGSERVAEALKHHRS